MRLIFIWTSLSLWKKANRCSPKCETISLSQQLSHSCVALTVIKYKTIYHVDGRLRFPLLLGDVFAMEWWAFGPRDQLAEGWAGEGEQTRSPDHQLPTQHQRQTLHRPYSRLGTCRRLRLSEGSEHFWSCSCLLMEWLGIGVFLSHILICCLNPLVLNPTGLSRVLHLQWKCYRSPQSTEKVWASCQLPHC